MKSIIPNGSSEMEELICYCFNHTFHDIESDVKLNGKSTIEEKIALQKRTGGCQCEVKNPKSR